MGITKTSLAVKLHNEGKLTDKEYNKLTGQNGETEVDVIIRNGREIDFGRIEAANSITIGEAYEDSWIGRSITYTSGNNINEWIVLGKDKNGDILITTKEAVGSEEITCTTANWCNHENILKTACTNYIGTTGTLGIKSIQLNEGIKDIRSINLEDINNANSKGKLYWIASKNMSIEDMIARYNVYCCQDVYFNWMTEHVDIGIKGFNFSISWDGGGQGDREDSFLGLLRPVVVVSSNLPFTDNSIIGNYAEYNNVN